MPGLNEDVNRRRGVSVYSPTRPLARPRGRANAGTAQRILSGAPEEEQVSAATPPRIEVPQAPQRGGRAMNTATPTPVISGIDAFLSRNRPVQQQEAPEPGGVQGVLYDVAQTGPGRVIFGALDVLDRPRRYVQSATKELTDMIGGQDWSWDDFREQASNPEFGFRHIVDEPTGIEWLDKTIGFAGDVLMDPLTYVGGSALRAGAGGTTRVRAAARAAEAGVDEAVAARIGRYGWAAANRETRAVLREAGEQIYDYGYRFKVPFGPSLRLPGTGGLERMTTAAGGAVRSALGSNPLWSAARRWRTTEALEEATERILTGNGNMSIGTAFDLVTYHQGARLGRGNAVGLLNAAAAAFQRQHGDKVLSNLIAEAEEGGATVVNEFFDYVLKVADDAGLDIPVRKNYVPHIFTDGGLAWLRGDTPTARAFRTELALGDDLTEISPHLMERRLRPRQNDPYRIGGVEFHIEKGTIKEFNDAFARLVPDAGFKLLDDDFSTIVAKYVSSISDDFGKLGGVKALLKSKRAPVRSAKDREVLSSILDEAATKTANKNFGKQLKAEVTRLKSPAASLADQTFEGIASIQGMFGAQMSEAIDALDLIPQLQDRLDNALIEEQDLARSLRVDDLDGQSPMQRELAQLLEAYDTQIDEVYKEMDAAQASLFQGLKEGNAALNEARAARAAQRPAFKAEWEAKTARLLELTEKRGIIYQLDERLRQARMMQALHNRRVNDPSYLNLAAGERQVEKVFTIREEMPDVTVNVPSPQKRKIEQAFRAQKQGLLDRVKMLPVIRRWASPETVEFIELAGIRMQTQLIEQQRAHAASAALRNRIFGTGSDAAMKTGDPEGFAMRQTARAHQEINNELAGYRGRLEDLKGNPAQRGPRATLQKLIDTMTAPDGRATMINSRYDALVATPLKEMEETVRLADERYFAAKRDYDRAMSDAVSEMTDESHQSYYMSELNKINEAERRAYAALPNGGDVPVTTKYPAITTKRMVAGRLEPQDSAFTLGRILLYADGETRRELNDIYLRLRNETAPPPGVEAGAWRKERRELRKRAKKLEAKAGGMTERQYDAALRLNELQQVLDDIKVNREPLRLSKLTPGQRDALESNPMNRTKRGSTTSWTRAKDAHLTAETVMAEKVPELLSRGALSQDNLNEYNRVVKQLGEVADTYDANPMPSTREHMNELAARVDRWNGFLTRYKVALDAGLEPDDKLASYILVQELETESKSLASQINKHRQLLAAGKGERDQMAQYELLVTAYQTRINNNKAQLQQLREVRDNGGYVDPALVKQLGESTAEAERELRRMENGPRLGLISDEVDTLVHLLVERIEDIDGATGQWVAQRNFARDAISPIEQSANLQAQISQASADLAYARIERSRIQRALDIAEANGDEFVTYRTTRLQQTQVPGNDPPELGYRAGSFVPTESPNDPIGEITWRERTPQANRPVIEPGEPEQMLHTIPIADARRIMAQTPLEETIAERIDGLKLRLALIDGSAERELTHLRQLMADATYSGSPEHKAGRLARLQQDLGNYEALPGKTEAQRQRMEFTRARVEMLSRPEPASAVELGQIQKRIDDIEDGIVVQRQILAGGANAGVLSKELEPFGFIRDFVRSGGQLDRRTLRQIQHMLGNEAAEQARVWSYMLHHLLANRQTLNTDEALDMIEQLEAVFGVTEFTDKLGRKIVKADPNKIGERMNQMVLESQDVADLQRAAGAGLEEFIEDERGFGFSPNRVDEGDDIEALMQPEGATAVRNEEGRLTQPVLSAAETEVDLGNWLISKAALHQQDELRTFAELWKALGFTGREGSKARLQDLGYRMSNGSLDMGKLRLFVIEQLRRQGYDPTSSIERRLKNMQARRSRIRMMQRGLGMRPHNKHMKNPARFFTIMQEGRGSVTHGRSIVKAMEAEYQEYGNLALPAHQLEIVENRVAHLQREAERAKASGDLDRLEEIGTELLGLEEGRLAFDEEAPWDVIEDWDPADIDQEDLLDGPTLSDVDEIDPATTSFEEPDLLKELGLDDDAMAVLEGAFGKPKRLTRAEYDEKMARKEFLAEQADLTDEQADEYGKLIEETAGGEADLIDEAADPSMVDDPLTADAEVAGAAETLPQRMDQSRPELMGRSAKTPKAMTAEYDRLASLAKFVLDKYGNNIANVPKEHVGRLTAVLARVRWLANKLNEVGATGSRQHELQRRFEDIGSKFVGEGGYGLQAYRNIRKARPSIDFDVWNILGRGAPSVSTVRSSVGSTSRTLRALQPSGGAAHVLGDAPTTPGIRPSAGSITRGGPGAAEAGARRPLEKIKSVQDRLRDIRKRGQEMEQSILPHRERVENESIRLRNEVEQLEQDFNAGVEGARAEIEATRSVYAQKVAELDEQKAQLFDEKIAAEEAANQAMIDADIRLGNVRSEILAIMQDKTQLQALNETVEQAIRAKPTNAQEASDIIESLRALNKDRAAWGAAEQDSVDMVETLLGQAAKDAMDLADAQLSYDTAVRRLGEFQQGKLKVADVMTDQLKRGWDEVAVGTKLAGGDGVVVSSELAKAIKNVDAAFRRDETWKVIERYTNFFKTYATAKPGFHVRNAMSGVFMNLVDNVRMRHIAAAPGMFRDFRRNPQRYWEEAPENVRRALLITFGSGAGGQFMEHGVGTATSTSSKMYRRLMNNAYTRWSRRAGEYVEGSIRFAMALDSVEKGLTDAAALDRITRYHFDYTQVSRLDRSAKKLIPFWTFMSRNFPLQIESMWLRPRTYLQYQSFMRNFAEDADPMTPQYWLAQGAWTLDENAEERDSPWYISPDLPHLRVAEPLIALAQGEGAKAGLSDINPLFMAPIEALALGEKVYTGQPIEGMSEPSAAMHALAPLLPLLNAIGATERGGESGNLLVSNKAQHIARSLLPTLDWAERLSDNQGNREGRRDETLIRNLGVPVLQLNDNLRNSTRRSQYYDRRDRARAEAEIARS